MPDDILKQLGHQMREARKARGLTQEQLSAQTNVSVRHIAKIEKGTMNTSFEILHTLVTCLGTSLDVLLYPDLPMEQQEVAKLVGCYKACPPGERGLIMKTVQCLANELIERKQKEVAHLGPTWPEANE